MSFSLTASTVSLSIVKSSKIQYKLILNWAKCLNFVLMIGAQEIKESELFFLFPILFWCELWRLNSTWAWRFSNKLCVLFCNWILNTILCWCGLADFVYKMWNIDIMALLMRQMLQTRYYIVFTFSFSSPSSSSSSSPSNTKDTRDSSMVITI